MVERRKRQEVMDEKLEKNNQLLQEINEKDREIMHLQRQLGKLNTTIVETLNRSATPMGQSVVMQSIPDF